MKKLGILFCFAAFTLAANSALAFPTVTINGVKHYLINEDEAGEKLYWSTEDGYCLRNGYQWATGSNAWLNRDVEPLAALNASGDVIASWPKNNGSMWVITSISCQ